MRRPPYRIYNRLSYLYLDLLTLTLPRMCHQSFIMCACVCVEGLPSFNVRWFISISSPEEAQLWTTEWKKGIGPHGPVNIVLNYRIFEETLRGVITGSLKVCFSACSKGFLFQTVRQRPRGIIYTALIYKQARTITLNLTRRHRFEQKKAHSN